MSLQTRLFVLLLVLVAAISWRAAGSGPWSTAEIEVLKSLSISALEALPVDRTNRVADDPQAAALGRALFFDTRLSSNGRVSCGTCHQPERGFQDGTPLAAGVGVTNRRTMPIAGTAYSPFLFWDGRKDSQWAQALGPLESAVEHGGSRAQYALVVATHYRAKYEAVFGSLPDLSGVTAHAGPVNDPGAASAWTALSSAKRDDVTRVFVNIGKAIAAFERQLQPARSRFDNYVDGLDNSRRSAAVTLTADEIAGLKLFIGSGNCTQCHNGPLFTNNEFHNTGVPAVKTLPADRGRMAGTKAVLADEFNCRSRWSDARTRCDELEFMAVASHEQERAFKVPSLRGVAERTPYMHAGQIASLADVLDHYNRPPAAPAGHSELKPLGLNARQLRQLEAFLKTLGR